MTDARPVVIVGMGPVGATLALLLGRAGVATVVVEREPAVFALPRAVALDDEALRILQAAGLDEDDRPPLVSDRDVRLLSAAGESLVAIPPSRSVNGHPQVAFFHQADLERKLRSRISRQPTVEVLLGYDMECLGQERGGVRLTVCDRRTGSRRELRAGWVIGCDGAAGTVRRLLGIRLRGFTSRRRWLVVDVSMRRTGERVPFEFICDPARPTVSAPLPGGLHRWEFMLLPGEDPGRAEQAERARVLVARMADGEDFEILRASAYTFHARIAEHWSAGRVLLAGDAAHLTPPFAGLGLSLGLRDAHNLAWKIAAVTERSVDPVLLGSYESERRPDAVRLIALAVALGVLVQARRRRLVVARDAVIRRVADTPTVGRRIAGGDWKPTPTYGDGFVYPRRRRRAGEGSPFPQPVVRVPDVGDRRLDDVLGATFSIVAWRIAPVEALDAGLRRALAALGGRILRVETDTASCSRASDVVIADRGRVLEHWFARAGVPLALLRPDHHVYAVFDGSEAPAVVSELGRWIGSNPTLRFGY